MVAELHTANKSQAPGCGAFAAVGKGNYAGGG